MKKLLVALLLLPLVAYAEVPPKIVIKIDGQPVDITGKVLEIFIDAKVPQPTTTTVTGGMFVYDNTAHPATGKVTGPNGIDLGAPTITYTDSSSAVSPNPPINAGAYTATGSYAGTVDYLPSSGTASLTVTQATPTIAVTGGTYSFDSQPHPATGVVTGVAGVSLGVPVFTYTDSAGATSSSAPVNAGVYTATGSYAGSANYAPGSSTTTVTITAPPVPTGILRHPLDTADPTTPEAKRFLAYADSLLPNAVTNEVFPIALAFKITGDQKYGAFAAKRAYQIADYGLSQASTGVRPPAMADSYLEAGKLIGGPIYGLAWCKQFMKPDEVLRTEDYCRQGVVNLKDTGTTDTWSGKPFSDQAWAINNAYNNYFYSFLTAHVAWALYSNDPAWMDYVRTSRFGLVKSAMGNAPGGGSFEGTGYGAAQFKLFEQYGVWKVSTGEDVSAATTHCKNSLVYYVQATTPPLSTGQRWVAPIGDQARDQSVAVYDYLRALMLWGVYLNPATPEAEQAREWLRLYPRMYDNFNFYYDMVPTSGTITPATATSYSALKQGHYFARSDWTSGADLIDIVAGWYSQGHGHQEHGSFNFWHAGKWALIKPNNVSFSGLVGVDNTWWLNQLLFTKSGVDVKQVFGKTALATITDDGVNYKASLDLSPMYVGASVAGVKWTRSITWSRPTVTITVDDSYTIPTGVVAQAMYFVNSTTAPVSDGVSTVTGDKLRLSVVVPTPTAYGIVNLLTYKNSDGTLQFPSGKNVYRINISDPARPLIGKFTVKLEGL